MLHASRRECSRRLQRATLPALTPLFVALSFALPGLAHAAGSLPSAGHFVAGTGSITSNATSLTINQKSNRGIIDWTSFSIGSGDRVNVMNGTGTTLNRVTGTDLSSILGTLSATGSVYLINPQGIVIGSSGVVSTGGRFVASTLDVDNAAFMKGGPLTFTSYASSFSGNVVNLGKISSTGGDVFLVALDSITNSGTISAPKGSAEFAVGDMVQLSDSSTGPHLSIRYLDGSSGTVINRGVIEAAQINVQAADGNIYALAGNHAVIRATGTATRDGHVWLVADMGKVTIDSAIEARNANGSGGTVDTNAANLVIADDTNGKPSVNAGQWNITAPSFTVTGLTAPVLQRSLNNGTSIDLQATGFNGSGDIDVASSIQWSGAASLTLGAYHSLAIEAAAKLKNTGSGHLTLRADSTAIDNGGSIINNGTVDWSASNGIVSAFYDMNGSYSAGKLLGNTSWTSPTYSGIVTQITGYKLVNSLTDLKKVNGDLGGNYALGKDIDASATSDGSYVAIGSDNTPFTGQFDGEGHTISSLTLHGGTAAPVTLGLFGTLGESAVVRDLNVSGNTVIAANGPFKSGLEGVEGILAGNNYGTILRVNTSGNIDNLYNLVWYDLTTAGGLVGVNHGTIVRSSSSVTGNTGGTFGGLVGENDGVIYRSYASGPVQTQDMVGGLYDSHGNSGGLVALNNGTISQSYATGAVSAGCQTYSCGAGGLVDINNGTISQSYETGAVSVSCADDCSAALVNVNTGTIRQSFATGQVTGNLDPVTGNPVANGIAALNSGEIGNDVYWNKDTTTATTGVGSGTPTPDSHGLTTAQMSHPGSFSGWDFSSTGAWAMSAGEPRPILRWQLEPSVASN